MSPTVAPSNDHATACAADAVPVVSRHVARSGVFGLVLLAATVASAAEASYPFEGTWIRAEHTCSATTVRARTYTAKDVDSPRGRCMIRRIAGSGPLFELLEDCRRSDLPGTVTETIRMTSPDSMTLRRQVVRLKIPRQVRYTRCSIASPSASPPAHPAKAVAPVLPAEQKKP